MMIEIMFIDKLVGKMKDRDYASDIESVSSAWVDLRLSPLPAN